MPEKNDAGRESISVAPPDCSILCTSSRSTSSDLLSVAVKIFGDGLLAPISTPFFSTPFFSAAQAA